MQLSVALGGCLFVSLPSVGIDRAHVLTFNADFFYPEVSGLSLEEIKDVFDHGFGVKYARQLRKDRKDIIKERLRTQEKPLAVGH